MNVINLGFYLLILVCGGIGYGVGSRVGGLADGVAGLVIGMVVPIIAVMLLTAVAAIWARCFPCFPKCANDKCSAADYRAVEITREASKYVCNCGDVYFLTGPRFMRVRDGGTTVPYMIRNCCRWKLDDGESGTAKYL